MGIGKKIKEAREELNLTQADLARLVGVTSSAITNYENEVSHPKEQVLYKLMDALKVDANYLFHDVLVDLNVPQSPTLSYKDQEHIKKYQSLNETGKDQVDSYTDYILSNPANLAPAPQMEKVKMEIAAKGIGPRTMEVEVDPRELRKARARAIVKHLQNEENNQ